MIKYQNDVTVPELILNRRQTPVHQSTQIDSEEDTFLVM